MKTVIIQAGNSDNKLTQQEWSQFVLKLKGRVASYALRTHFFGGSSTFEPWQNVAMVVEVHHIHVELLKSELAEIRAEYNQDSVAVTVGDTIFV